MKKLVLSAAATAAYIAVATIAGSHDANASLVTEPDCLDSANPSLCTTSVGQIRLEVPEMVEAYDVGDIDTIMSFHTSPGLSYKLFTDFIRGAGSYENNVLVPFYAYVGDSIGLELSNLRFAMINPDTIVQYGEFTETITFKNGDVVSTPKRIMLTWVRNRGNTSTTRPFLIAANMQETIVDP